MSDNRQSMSDIAIAISLACALGIVFLIDRIRGPVPTGEIVQIKPQSQSAAATCPGSASRRHPAPI